MALPLPTSPIEIWAAADYILPNTHNLNKERPIDDLWLKGYDMRQKPTVEDFNYLLNMVTSWVKYVIDGALPEFKEEIRQELEDFKNEINIIINNFRQEINDKIDAMQQFLIPVGAILIWSSSTVPSGFLELNGQSFNKLQNPKLALLHPSGNVPDWRGRFIRAWAHGSSVDPDSNRGIGSLQGDAIRNITGSITGAGSTEEGATYTGALYNPGLYKGADGGHDTDSGIGFDASRVVPTAPENRPVNVAAMYIIKTDMADNVPGPVVPTGIIVSPDSFSGIIGQTRSISSQVMPLAIAPQYPVTYTSQNTGVATVSSTGVITITGLGTTSIIVSISTGLSTTVRVTGIRVLTSLSLSPPTGNIEVGSSLQLGIITSPSDYTEALVWTSSNDTIATVNSLGTVFGRIPGPVSITVRGATSNISDSKTVTIVSATPPAPSIPDAGAIGSVAYCEYAGTGLDPQTLGFGSTISGSKLTTTSLATQVDGDARLVSSGATLEGTWRCLGYINRAEGVSERFATLFQRIS